MQIRRYRSSSKAAREVRKVGVALLFALTGAISSANSIPTLAHGGAAAASTTAQFTVDGFEEAVVPTAATTAEEDAAIRLAAGHFSPATLEGLASFDAFLASYPNSGWRLSIFTNLGLSYYREGYFSKAIATWERAWSVGKSVTSPSPRARALIDRAIGELIRMHARLGHKADLEALLLEVAQRPLTGPATEAIAGAKQGLWRMQSDPGLAFLCGPKALKSLALLFDSPKSDRVKMLDEYRSRRQGVSLAELTKLVADLRLPYRPAFRSAQAPIPVPSLVHWKVNHYAAIVGEHNGRYHIQDPTFGVDLWLSRAALESEGSGFFMIPKSLSAEGWRDVTVAEAATVHGMGLTTESDPSATRPTDVKAKPTCSNAGMCGYNFHEMLVSLNITDRPLGYQPAVGPAVQFELTYNQREARQPAVPNFFNFGPKWTSNWLAYIVDDPRLPGTNVMRYAAGGGAYDEYGFDGSSGQFTPERGDYSILVKTFAAPPVSVRSSELPIRYERRMQDGSMEVYEQSDGALNYPRRIFLTKLIDRYGNAVSLFYDDQRRLATITDAVGRQTELEYKSDLFPLQVTQITDPFQRRATIKYDTMGRLQSITDVLGMVSTVSYDAGNFVKTLKTPYGSTHFTYGETGTNRWLEAQDPKGQKERVEFRQEAPGIGLSDPRGAPAGMETYNQYLHYRNTFYWDKNVYPQWAGDYSKARIRHWYHDINVFSATAAALQSSKEPSEGRVWFGTPGDNQVTSGVYDRPNQIGRVLDDGSSQVTKTTYNSLGNVSSVTDPTGRMTEFDYAPNQIDVVQVRQGRAGAAFEVVASATYDERHLPLTVTDAAGQTSEYRYNPAGQLRGVTDPLGNTTSYQYDELGQMTFVIDRDDRGGTVFPCNCQTDQAIVLRLTYDSFGRLASRTDAVGHKTEFSYDPFDRITKVTYPNGSTELTAWKWLDRAAFTDRAGRATQYRYDALRNLTAVIDPMNRTHSFSYYPSGALHTLKDANGHVTTWDRDLQGRVTAKRYADGRQDSYQWEAYGARLKSRTDALGQIKSLTYTVDDRLAEITFAGGAVAMAPVSLSYDVLYPRLTTMVDGIGTTKYGYGKVGSLGALQVILDDGPYANDEIAYQYDALGRVAQRSLANSAEAFTFDKVGRQIKGSSILGTINYKYLDQTDHIIQKAMGASIGAKFEYEGGGNTGDWRLSAVVNVGPARDYRFTSNAVGSITSIGDTPAVAVGLAAAAPRTWTYQYDDADRLLGAQASDGRNFTYTFDKASNLTAWQTPAGSQSASYNAVNQPTSTTEGQIRHDAAGNVTEDARRTYRWDADARLVEIGYKGQPTLKSAFRYDGFGRRVAVIETSGKRVTETRYRWCGATICQERDSSDAVTKRYFEDGVQIVSSNTRLFYNKDHLGSVRDATNVDTKKLAASYDYDPYGNLLASSGSTGAIDFRYAGMLYHPVSGLYLTQYRAYDPSRGRWLSRDPIGEEGGINLYAYVGGNPIGRTDPSGLTQCDIDAAVSVVRTELPKLHFPANGPVANLKISSGSDGMYTFGAADLMQVSERYLDVLSERRQLSLLDTVIHEVLHANPGPGNPAVQRHDWINPEAGRLAAELSAAFQKERSKCGCEPK